MEYSFYLYFFYAHNTNYDNEQESPTRNSEWPIYIFSPKSCHVHSNRKTLCHRRNQKMTSRLPRFIASSKSCQNNGLTQANHRIESTIAETNVDEHARTKNTSLLYKAKQKEFGIFCDIVYKVLRMDRLS